MFLINNNYDYRFNIKSCVYQVLCLCILCDALGFCMQNDFVKMVWDASMLWRDVINNKNKYKLINSFFTKIEILLCSVVGYWIQYVLVCHEFKSRWGVQKFFFYFLKKILNVILSKIFQYLKIWNQWKHFFYNVLKSALILTSVPYHLD